MKNKRPAIIPFDSAAWCWNQAGILADEAQRFLMRTGGIGAVALFYRETTAVFDGTLYAIPSHIHAPLGAINAGVTVRGNLTRDQMAALFHAAIRRLPVLPLEGRLEGRNEA